MILSAINCWALGALSLQPSCEMKEKESALIPSSRHVADSVLIPALLIYSLLSNYLVTESDNFSVSAFV